MAKAEKGTGGAFVNVIAYKADTWPQGKNSRSSPRPPGTRDAIDPGISLLERAWAGTLPTGLDYLSASCLGISPPFGP